MRKERISANVDRKTRLRIKKAAEELGISESHLIAQAVETDLDKIDLRKDLSTARAERDQLKATVEVVRQQRDRFKAKFDDALSDMNVAEAKIEALKNRGLFARIFNRPPKI